MRSKHRPDNAASSNHDDLVTAGQRLGNCQNQHIATGETIVGREFAGSGGRGQGVNLRDSKRVFYSARATLAREPLDDVTPASSQRRRRQP